jgi:hypothetical protein
VLVGSSARDCELLSRVLYDTRCTSLEQAKALQHNSEVLSAVPLALRDELLAAVAAAEVQGKSHPNIFIQQRSHNVATSLTVPCLLVPTTLIAGTRPLLPSQDYPACPKHEFPPDFERQLYLILRDEQIRAADPHSLLERALKSADVCRLQAAKLLKADSPVLARVSSAARARFLKQVCRVIMFEVYIY